MHHLYKHFSRAHKDKELVVKQEIIEAINREKLSEEPNFDTIRMLQQMLDDIDNESD